MNKKLAVTYRVVPPWYLLLVVLIVVQASFLIVDGRGVSTGGNLIVLKRWEVCLAWGAISFCLGIAIGRLTLHRYVSAANRILSETVSPQQPKVRLTTFARDAKDWSQKVSDMQQQLVATPSRQDELHQDELQARAAGYASASGRFYAFRNAVRIVLGFDAAPKNSFTEY
ncbi:MAG: hypothetical protein KBD16_02895 [Candidatus Pacebacteria bacterium]|nr:hypothetical protein [Candidatus Paceibacterota bacterium]